MKIKNKIIIGALLLAVGGIIGTKWQAYYDAGYIEKLTSQPQANKPADGASIMIDRDPEPPLILGVGPVRDNQNLFDLTKFNLALQQRSQDNLPIEYKDYGDMGYLVTKIGDKVNGTDGRFWQYWVNNEQVQVAANKYIVKPGDSIVWKFIKSNQ